MLARNFVYLRDAVATEFHSSSLTGKFTKTSMQEQIRSMRAAMEEQLASRPKKPSTLNPNYPCGHCRSGIHEGRQNMCSLSKVKLERARAMATTIVAKIKDHPDNADSIIQQLLNEEE
jgi:hypothetical protein